MGAKDKRRKNLNQGCIWIVGILATLFFTPGCSSIHYVQLSDRLPAKASALEGRKVGYEARLVKNGAILSKQFATGEAERLKIMGTEQADAVVGDLFADMMNRLNVAKLFRDAGL